MRWRCIASAVELRPSWDEGRWYIATILYEIDRYAEARDAFAEVLRRQPTHAGAAGLKGLCEFQLRRFDQALIDLLQAREMGVSRSPAIATVVRYHAAILLTRIGEFELANQMLTEFAAEQRRLGAGPGGVRGQRAADAGAVRRRCSRTRVIGWCWPAGPATPSRRGAWTRRATALDELVARYPNVPHVHYARGVLLLTDNADRALDEFRRELEISPSHVPARLQIAFEFLKRGEPSRARGPAAEAAKLAPEHFADAPGARPGHARDR